MKKKLLLLTALLFSFTVFSHAYLYDPDLGNSVKSGSYYTFPYAEVYSDDPTVDLIYTISIQFVREVAAGDQIILPNPLPSGWVKKAKSTPTACFIDINSGAQAGDVQAFLRDQLKVALSSGKLGNEISVILIMEEDAKGREIYWFAGTEHWYEYVDGMHPWWKAYNEALARDFAGAGGYLATITSAEENNFVYNVSSGKMAWLGGTRGDLSTVATDSPELSGAPTANFDYWYWASGPEYNSYDPLWSAFYKKKKYSDPDPNPDPWDPYGLPYEYNAWGTNQPDNSKGNETCLHTGSYNNGLWNDYEVNGYHPNGSGGKKITGFMVEYDSYIYKRTMGAIVGFESKKNASIDGVYKNGTLTDPVKVVKGDVILFEITAVNSSRDNHMVSIYDSIPKGLEVIESSITDDGDYSYDPLEDQAYINWWGVEVPLEGKKVVSFKAKPASKTTKLMKNTARVTSGNNPPTQARAAQAPPLYEFQTDTTYHLGKICEVSFDYEPGGTHSGLDTTQILDYGDKPKAGVVPTPPPGRKFVGWSYPEYTSWKDEVKSAALGILDYSTITAYGDIPLTARWDFRFDEDTLYSCEPPMKLESGHDGLSYEWILPDGTKKTTEDIQAQTSGKYILNTNYGSMITSDTIVVLFAFDENVKIVDLSPGGPKAGRPQIYTVSVDTALKNVTYEWTFSGGGDPATSTADTATVVYNSTSGTKTISVKVTVTMPGLGTPIVCPKTFTMDIKIYGDKRNFFVDRNVVGGDEDGSSWANAYRRVEDAVNRASSGDCVWVAKGEYSPPAGKAYMLNHDSVEIYGGFGAWEDYIDERDYGKNPTILRSSGTSVIINTNAGSASRWDGFTIQGGNAEKGGGILNDNSSLTIANCIIRNNKAVEGSGIYTLRGNPLFYNLEISGNTAQDGTVYTDSSDPRMINVTISGNRATNGGGIYNSNANPKIYNSIIWGNKAEGNAVMVNSLNSSPYFTYNLIERYGDVDKWDESYGINGGNNKGESPLFKRNGFDKEGNMQAGDYRLGVSSPCINRGLDRYIYDIPVRSGTHLETRTETVYLSVIPYDVQCKNRIEFDRIDMGAYEYARDEALPSILRQVYLPDVEGLLIDPAPGENYVESQKDFIFTIAALPGYSLDDLKIETGDESRDKDGLKIVLNGDSMVTVTLVKVTETILVTINGISPTLSNEVGNNDIESGQKVWSYRNDLHINADKRTEIQIYSVAGQLYLKQSVDAGETVISLRQGIYFVRMDGQTYKIVVRM